MLCSMRATATTSRRPKTFLRPTVIPRIGEMGCVALRREVACADAGSVAGAARQLRKMEKSELAGSL
jgi:hypothetical protein